MVVVVVFVVDVVLFVVVDVVVVYFVVVLLFVVVTILSMEFNLARTLLLTFGFCKPHSLIPTPYPTCEQCDGNLGMVWEKLASTSYVILFIYSPLILPKYHHNYSLPIYPNFLDLSLEGIVHAF